jgi:L-erythro-3,5-diaminohexanoate dehydrogenase
MSSASEQNVARYLGIHRVIEPRGTLPQPAWKLDNTPGVYPTEP